MSMVKHPLPCAEGTQSYSGKTAAIATMHGKEQVIVPAMRDVLGLVSTVPAGLDTDRLGTFSGEVERKGTMLETAIAKARLGMASEGTLLGIASEGSFGPDPVLSLVGCGQELMVLVDDDRGVVIRETLLTHTINFGARAFAGDDDPSEFLDAMRFPSHGILLWPAKPTLAIPIIKDLANIDEIRGAMQEMARYSHDGQVTLFTDMRAHRNPTRMATLRELGEKLAHRIASPCPHCGSPGFGVVRYRSGLPCHECGIPTQSVRGEIFGCVSCAHTAEHSRKDGKIHEDPTYCEYCNP